MTRFLYAAALSVAATLCSHTALAAAPACGSYVDAESGARLEIDDSERARIVRNEMAPASQHYRLAGEKLRLFDVDDGYASDYTLSADGRTVTEVDPTFRKTFVLREARACGTPPPPVAAGSCRADIDACISGIHDATPARLRAACDDGLAFACVRWIDAAREKDEDPELEQPEACREGSPTFSEEDCNAAVSAMLARALTEAAGALHADDAPLPATTLDALPALCARDGSAKVCNKVAEELWIASRLEGARDALGIACKRGGDPDACRNTAPLAAVATLRAMPANALPCGRYVAETGLMSELDFGDRGLVGSFGGSLRARIEDGRIRIRHDKGGDFVYARLDGDALLGLDRWNRYAVYRRDGGATRCAAPTAFVEKPLVMDCPQPGTESIAACCARGSLHGCNALGHQRALAGDWAGAKPEYLKVCSAGVRAGCENLARVFEHGDDGIPEILDALCAKDPKHVACDVRETTPWATLMLSRAADELLKDLEEDVDAPDEGAPREDR